MAVYPKSLKVYVRQEDINKGCLFSARGCQVARALMRGMKAAAVTSTYFIVNNTDSPIGWSQQYVMPKKASRFVLDFDAGKSVKPISFEAWRSE